MSQPVHPSQAESDFRRFLAARGLTLDALNVKQGVAAVLAYFEEVRFAPLASGDGDMLLFQWGTYDWGEGEHFELDITRQLMWPSPEGEEDDEIWQLSLRFRFAPELADLASGNEWCEDVAGLPELRAFIDACEAYQSTATRDDAEPSLTYGSAE